MFVVYRGPSTPSRPHPIPRWPPIKVPGIVISHSAPVPNTTLLGWAIVGWPMGAWGGGGARADAIGIHQQICHRQGEVNEGLKEEK